MDAIPGPDGGGGAAGGAAGAAIAATGGAPGSGGAAGAAFTATGGAPAAGGAAGSDPCAGMDCTVRAKQTFGTNSPGECWVMPAVSAAGVSLLGFSCNNASQYGLIVNGVPYPCGGPLPSPIAGSYCVTFASAAAADPGAMFSAN